MLKSYAEGVRQFSSPDADGFDERLKSLEELRLKVRQTRLEWENHEIAHGCVRKPSQKAERPASESKMGS